MESELEDTGCDNGTCELGLMGSSENECKGIMIEEDTLDGIGSGASIRAADEGEGVVRRGTAPSADVSRGTMATRSCRSLGVPEATDVDPRWRLEC